MSYLLIWHLVGGLLNFSSDRGEIKMPDQPGLTLEIKSVVFKKVLRRLTIDLEVINNSDSTIIFRSAGSRQEEYSMLLLPALRSAIVIDSDTAWWMPYQQPEISFSQESMTKVTILKPGEKLPLHFSFPFRNYTIRQESYKSGHLTWDITRSQNARLYVAFDYRYVYESVNPGFYFQGKIEDSILISKEN
jgi:hypothetical protein